MTFQPLKTVDYCCILLLAESGYQGTHKHNKNLILPVKKKKGLFLSAEDQAHNKALLKQRVFIKHINRRCKILRIVKVIYRGQAQELLADLEFNWQLLLTCTMPLFRNASISVSL